MKSKFEVIKKEENARRGVFETVHGTVQTPAFMNVATVAAIKGGLSTEDLRKIHRLCFAIHIICMFAPEMISFMIWEVCTSLPIGISRF